MSCLVSRVIRDQGVPPAPGDGRRGRDSAAAGVTSRHSSGRDGSREQAGQAAHGQARKTNANGNYFRPTSPLGLASRGSRGPKARLRFTGARSLLLSFGPSPTRLRHRYADPAPPGRSRAPGFCSLYWCVVSVSPPRHSRCVARDPWRRPVTVCAGLSRAVAYLPSITLAQYEFRGGCSCMLAHPALSAYDYPCSIRALIKTPPSWPRLCRHS